MTAKMKRVMAVKKPIARTIWNPRDCARVARIKALRHDHVPFSRAGIDIVAPTVPAAIYTKIKPMKMEGVTFKRSVNPTPVDRFTLRARRDSCAVLRSHTRRGGRAFMPGPTAAVELLPARRWPSRVKRSDTLREILQGCGPAPGNRTEVGGGGTRVPRKTGVPLRIFGFLTITLSLELIRSPIKHSIALSSGTFPYLSLAKIITVMLQGPRLGVGQSFGEPQLRKIVSTCRSFAKELFSVP
jgi:hypothetical protein